MSGTWLVIPSNRMDNLSEFFTAWEGKGGWDKVLIVEDAPTRTNPDRSRGKGWLHYSHKEIAAVLGNDDWIISKRDSACRCFGFLIAWSGGADRVLTLDDDVRPIAELGWGKDHPSLVELHQKAMEHRRWVPSVPGLRVRGLPYVNHGRLPDVVANVGLWTGHPDVDAVQQMALLGRSCNPIYALPHSNWIVPRGQFVPVCGMNLMLERRALPLAWFPLMGLGQPFARLDDIWMGVILKHCCDALGWSVSIGEPFVEHQKASDPFANLRKEAPGMEENETFWERVTAVSLGGCINALDCMNVLGHAVIGFGGNHAEYWKRIGHGMIRWAELFATVPKRM